MSFELQIRQMRPADLSAVFSLQCAVYPQAYHESFAALSSRLDRGPGCCFVAEKNALIAAYLLAHPWGGDLPVLHEPLPSHAGADHVFVHDLAVLPEFRCTALGQRLYGALREAALRSGFLNLRLVAVAGAEGFWQRLGFEHSQASLLPPAYGVARMMSADLSV